MGSVQPRVGLLPVIPRRGPPILNITLPNLQSEPVNEIPLQAEVPLQPVGPLQARVGLLPRRGPLTPKVVLPNLQPETVVEIPIQPQVPRVGLAPVAPRVGLAPVAPRVGRAPVVPSQAGAIVGGRLAPTTGALSSLLTMGTTPIAVLSQVQRTETLPKKQRDEMLQEINHKQDELPLLTIVKSAISLYSWEEMQRIGGGVRVTNTSIGGRSDGNDPHMSERGGVNDPRMGNVSLNVPCENCQQIDCPGHYGLISFEGGAIIIRLLLGKLSRF